MLDILFGWRKASKCKKLIRNVQCRLKLLKNKRGSIIRQLREDVAQLLKLGEEQRAFARVEQLFKDQTIMAAYDLLDHFCEFITINLPYIRRHRDCPNDINEAVSSLIYAAARCGDLPELQMLRKLFGERYGHKFAITAVELLTGNLVNCQIIEKLSAKSIPDDVKPGLLDEIAREYNIRRETIRIIDGFELQNQQFYNFPVGNKGPQCQANERDAQVIYYSTEAADIKASNYEDTQGKAPPSSSQVCRNRQSPNYSNLTCTCSSSVIVAQPHTDTLDFIPIHKNAVRAENQGELNPSCKPGMTPQEYSGQTNLKNCSSSCLSNPSQQLVMETPMTAPESLHQLPEVSVVYLDDIEEFNPTIQDGLSKDQRVFMFKSINMPTRENLGTQIENCEPWDGRAQSRTYRTKTKSSRKRLNRRSLSWGSQVSHSSASPSLSMKDVQSSLYYGDHFDYPSTEDPPRHKTHHPKKHQRKTSTEESWNSKFRSHKKKLPLPRQEDNKWETQKEFFGGEEKHFFNDKYSWRRSFRGSRIDRDMGFDCSLEHPCYFFTSDDKDEVESMCLKQQKGVRAGGGFPSHNFQQGWEGHCCSSPTEEAFKDSKSHMPNVKNVKKEQVEQEVISDVQNSCASSHACCSCVATPLTNGFTQPPYIRAQTLPPERPKNTATDLLLRSASFEFKQSNHSTGGSSSSSSTHVHPKLPDYDDLAAKFMALKKEHLQSKFQSS